VLAAADMDVVTTSGIFTILQSIRLGLGPSSLDEPLKEHTLVQAITRTNQVYPPNKTHGLIVDYLGVFDNVAKAFKFDETSVHEIISNIEELKASSPRRSRRRWRSSPASTAPSAATRALSRPRLPSRTTRRRTPSASPTAWCPSCGRQSARIRCCPRMRPTIGG
jgi:UvrB-like protein